MAKGCYGVALKAKELLGREYGLFKSKHKNGEFSFDNISEQELARLINEIEKQLRLDLGEGTKVNTIKV